MRNKKNYNNLFDSICMTILFFVCLVFYLVILWFGVNEVGIRWKE